MNRDQEIIKRIVILKDVLENSFENVDHNKQFYKGSRWYSSSDEFFKEFCQNIKNKFGDINNINNLSQLEIDQEILKILEDSAYKDYYYRYENQW